MAGFLDCLESMTRAGDGWTAHVLPDWMQGRTCFGGLMAAWAVRALRNTLEKPSPLVSVHVLFIGPAAGEVAISAQVLRSGRAVTQGEAQVTAGGQIVAKVLAIFGDQRPSKIAVNPPPPAPSKPIADGFEFPYLPGITPEFTKNFSYMLTEGAMPFTGAPAPGIGGFVKHATRHDRSAESVLALVDAWPAPVLPLANAPFAASTVNWSCHFVGDWNPADAPDDFLWFNSDTISAHDGYATTTATLYAGPKLIAWSEQLVAVFDKA